LLLSLKSEPKSVAICFPVKVPCCRFYRGLHDQRAETTTKVCFHSGANEGRTKPSSVCFDCGPHAYSDATGSTCLDCRHNDQRAKYSEIVLASQASCLNDARRKKGLGADMRRMPPSVLLPHVPASSRNTKASRITRNPTIYELKLV
jgi:hypothetical protein